MSITLVTGGASSGKTRFALSLIDRESKALFVATGVSTDTEMEERIKRHKSERPSQWETIEEPVELVGLFKRLIAKDNYPVIIDCLTFWISNLIYYKKFNREKILNEAIELAEILTKYQNKVVVVTNELGMGIVPSDRETRVFRSIAGEVNQIFSRKSGDVFLVVSGIPVNIKKLLR